WPMPSKTQGATTRRSLPTYGVQDFMYRDAGLSTFCSGKSEVMNVEQGRLASAEPRIVLACLRISGMFVAGRRPRPLGFRGGTSSERRWQVGRQPSSRWRKWLLTCWLRLRPQPAKGPRRLAGWPADPSLCVTDQRCPLLQQAVRDVPGRHLRTSRG